MRPERRRLLRRPETWIAFTAAFLPQITDAFARDVAIIITITILAIWALLSLHNNH